MAIQIKNYQETAQTVAFNGTQGLNSLTNAEYTNESDAISNTAGYEYADFELILASAAFGTGNDSHLRLYILPALDGTNYPTFTGGNQTTGVPEIEQYSKGTFKTSETTAAQRITLLDVPLPDTSFKIVIRSLATVDLAASGNSLRYRRWAREVA